MYGAYGMQGVQYSPSVSMPCIADVTSVFARWGLGPDLALKVAAVGSGCQGPCQLQFADENGDAQKSAFLVQNPLHTPLRGW